MERQQMQFFCEILNMITGWNSLACDFFFFFLSKFPSGQTLGEWFKSREGRTTFFKKKKKIICIVME